MQAITNSPAFNRLVGLYPADQDPYPTFVPPAAQAALLDDIQEISNYIQKADRKVIKLACNIFCFFSSFIAGSHLPALIKQAKLLSPTQPAALQLFATTFSCVCFWSSLNLAAGKALTTPISFNDHILKLQKEAEDCAKSVKNLSGSNPNETTLLKYRKEAQALCQKVRQLISQPEHQLIVSEQLISLSNCINEEILAEITVRTAALYDQNKGTHTLEDYHFDANFLTRFCRDGLRIGDCKAVAHTVWGHQEAYPFIAIDLAAKDIFTFEEFEAIKLTQPDGTVIPFPIEYQRQQNASIDKRKEKLEHILKGKFTFNFSKNATPSISLLKLYSHSPERHLKMRCIATAIKISVFAFCFYNSIALILLPSFSMMTPFLAGELFGLSGIRPTAFDTRPQAFARASKLGKLQWLLTSLSLGYLTGERVSRTVAGFMRLLLGFLSFMRNTFRQRIVSIYKPLAPPPTTPVNTLKRLAASSLAALDLLLTLLVTITCVVVAGFPVILILWARTLIDEIFGIYISFNNFSSNSPLLSVKL